MKKFKDYIKEEYGKDYNNPNFTLTAHNVLKSFTRAKADKVKSLEVSKKEYSILAYYFSPKVFWDGKTIWGIKLVIK